MAKDYYQILGIAKGATKDDVKKAFHKLAHKFHPDKAGGDESKFKEINEAYGVLSDEKKRAEYDTYGQTFSGGGGGGQGGDGSWDINDIFRKAQEGSNDFGFGGFGDMFGDIFGGEGGGRRKRGSDIAIDISINFQDSVFGITRKVLVRKNTVCEDCSGSGAAEGSKKKTCTTCNGRGKIKESKRSLFGNFTSERACSNCMGNGTIPESFCRTCKGEGIVKREEDITIAIPGGIEDGEMIRVTGAGEMVRGGMAGDLYVKIHVEKHSVFKKEGVNIIMPLRVKLSDAILGANYKIDTLDGNMEIMIPSGINHGEMLRVKGKGVVSGGRRGDLIIKISVAMPGRLSKKASDLINKLKEEGI